MKLEKLSNGFYVVSYIQRDNKEHYYIGFKKYEQAKIFFDSLQEFIFEKTKLYKKTHKSPSSVVIGSWLLEFSNMYINNKRK